MRYNLQNSLSYHERIFCLWNSHRTNVPVDMAYESGVAVYIFTEECCFVPIRYL